MSDEPEHGKGPSDPREAYTPFSPLEIKRLQRYADRVHAFEQTDFARVKTIGLTLTGEVGKGTTATVSGFTDQVLKQALMELRPLWLQEEVAGFQTPIELREIRVGQNGQVVNEEEVTPRRIFEDFLNGVYFHEDEDRLARIGAWLHTELQRCIFVNMVHDISHVYRSFATIVEGILAEPALRSGA